MVRSVGSRTHRAWRQRTAGADYRYERRSARVTWPDGPGAQAGRWAASAGKKSPAMSPTDETARLLGFGLVANRHPECLRSCHAVVYQEQGTDQTSPTKVHLASGAGARQYFPGDYDIVHNQGYVYLGNSYDTPEFGMPSHSGGPTPHAPAFRTRTSKRFGKLNCSANALTASASRPQDCIECQMNAQTGPANFALFCHNAQLHPQHNHHEPSKGEGRKVSKEQD